jgi:isopenicillin N synthase-like dioxygenase
VRPSTGTADLKESFQIGYTEAAQASWPAEMLAPGFKATCESFMAHAASVSDVLLRALALALEMPEEALSSEHDPKAPDVQTSLRLLHYPGLDPALAAEQAGRWRAGAHTDFDVLTLLFQRPGEGGLEVCPGRLASN